MEVRCERCHTEYDFDDALISDRGTTVRCTNCGLEFQVSSSNVHADFVVTTEEGEVHSFSSLTELQRAIMRGVVRENAVLTRGNEEPRKLGTIVELVPLLRQSRSVPPPPVEESDAPASPRVDPAPMAAVTRTRIGLPTVDDLAKAGGRVPSRLMERQRIQSPLSMRPNSLPPVSEAEPPSPRGKVPSLSDTLLGTRAALVRGTPDYREADEVLEAPELLPSSVPPPSSGSSRANVRTSSVPPPSSGAGRERKSSYPPPSSMAMPPALPPSAAFGGLAPPPSVAASSRGSEPRLEDFVEKSSRPSIQSATDLGRYAREAERASRDRLSGSIPGKPRARLAPILFAVLAGALGFFGYVNRDRFFAAKERPSPASGVPRAKTLDSRALLHLETESLRLRILGRPKTGVEAEAKTLVSGFDEVSARSLGIKEIDLFRLSGDARRARAKLAELAARETSASPSELYPYSLAMLEIEDGTASPPWSIIIERLTLASKTDVAPYLAKSALVWALVASTRVEEAKGALLDLKREKDVADSPLLGPLVALVEGKVDEVSDANAGTVEIAPVGIDASEEKDPSRRQVTADVKKLVAEADDFWAMGDRASAVTLYRKVYKKMGADHFLGQRAMARIKQAERELPSGGNQ